MTDLAHYSQPLPAAQQAVTDYQTKAVQRLTEWAHSAQAAHSIAVNLVGTSFVPQAFRGKPDEATAAILAGLEVGLQPMAALKSFDVIQGQAAPRALALRAIVQSFGHDMVLVESTATRCRMKGLRRGATEWQHVTWTIDRAKEMGLTGKQNWKQQPGAMLVARATGELARLIAADAILGLGYTAEEVADGGPVETIAAETVDTAPTGTKRLSRPRPAQQQAEPVEQAEEVHDAQEEPTPAPDTSDSITDAQMRKLQASFRDAGVSERADRLRYVNDVIAPEQVSSAKELTKRQAGLVIDALEADLTERPEEEPMTWDEADQ